MENQSIFPNISNPQEEMFVSAQTKIILCSILLVWSLVGNLLVIAVIFGNQNLKTNFNYLIVNMAISDLLIPLLQLPMKIVEVAGGVTSKWLVGGSLGDVLCRVCYFLADMSPAVSIFSLVIIAANRLFAIVYPVQAQMFSSKKGWILISATWIVSAAVFAPNLYAFQTVTFKEFTYCINNWPSIKSKTIWLSTTLIVVFVIPLVAITMLYSLMMYRVHRSSRIANKMLDNQQVRTRHRRNRQIFYISIAIVVVFVALWGPFFSFLFLVNFIWQWNIPLDNGTLDAVLFVVSFLGFLNSCVDPCIYFLFLKNYRQGLKRVLSTKRFRNASDSAHTFYVKTVRSSGPSTSGVNNEENCKLTQTNKSTQL